MKFKIKDIKLNDDKRIDKGLALEFDVVDDSGKKHTFFAQNTFVHTNAKSNPIFLYSIQHQLTDILSKSGISCNKLMFTLGGWASEEIELYLLGDLTTQSAELTRIREENTKNRSKLLTKGLSNHDGTMEQYQRLFSEGEKAEEKVLNEPNLNWTSFSKEKAGQLFDILKKNDLITSDWTKESFVAKIDGLNKVPYTTLRAVADSARELKLS